MRSRQNCKHLKDNVKGEETKVGKGSNQRTEQVLVYILYGIDIPLDSTLSSLICFAGTLRTENLIWLAG